MDNEEQNTNFQKDNLFSGKKSEDDETEYKIIIKSECKPLEHTVVIFIYDEKNVKYKILPFFSDWQISVKIKNPRCEIFISNPNGEFTFNGIRGDKFEVDLTKQTIFEICGKPPFTDHFTLV